jgi:hypothetical protein
MIGAGARGAKIRRIADVGREEKVGAHLVLYSPAGRISFVGPSPASKRRMPAIILAKHDRKPLCCWQ